MNAKTEYQRMNLVRNEMTSEHGKNKWIDSVFLSRTTSTRCASQRNPMKRLTSMYIVAMMIIGAYVFFLFHNDIARDLTGTDQGQGSVSAGHINTPMDDIVARTQSLPNQSLSFTAQTGQTFWAASPQNTTFVASDSGLKYFTGKVFYLRNLEDLIAQSEKGNESCGRTLDVLSWLMDQMNENGSRLMIAYGGLIHIHREKEFVHNTTGEYIDDDIDMWAAPEAVAHVGQLEEELFTQFGWSMRAFVTNRDSFVVLMQVFATCGHHVEPRAGKIYGSSEPAIEIYPIVSMDLGLDTEENNESRVVKDLWQGTTLAESLVHPPKQVNFKSIGTNNALHLQLPNEALEIMDCLYGNWRVRSGEHAGARRHCGRSG